MDLGTVCPACQKETDFTVDLREVLDKISVPNYDQQVKHGDLEFYFKPMTYKNLNDNNQLQFEEQKILQMLPDTEVENVEKVRLLSDALKKLTDVTIKALTQSIGAVKTPTALVSESEYIEEFLKNCDRAVFNRIRDFIIDIKGQAEMQPIKIVCDACNKDYEQQLTLDMSSFFAVAS
jgi:hypothetical protein